MRSWFGASDPEKGDGKGKLWLLLVVAVLGVALILFGSAGERSVSSPETETSPTPDEELRLYQAYLEERVRSICSSVNGVGNVTAIVTLSGGFESVYAVQGSPDSPEYVIIGSGTSAKPLFLSHTPPSIAGIGIVCDGADNLSVRAELLSLVSAAFHIPSNRIYITQGG